jgi:hypothetical protein
LQLEVFAGRWSGIPRRRLKINLKLVLSDNSWIACLEVLFLCSSTAEHIRVREELRPNPP